MKAVNCFTLILQSVMFCKFAGQTVLYFDGMWTCSLNGHACYQWQMHGILLHLPT